jgi:outer membrane protein assembly factor BamB
MPVRGPNLGRLLLQPTFWLCIVCLLTLRVSAQAQVIASGDDDQPEQPKPGGFSVQKEDQKVIDNFDDFRRYAGKKAWDRAFKALGAVIDATKNSAALVPLKDGFWVPTRQRVADCLTSLAPEGKAAYRLFYDAQAKQAWDQCQADVTAGKGHELDHLRTIVDRYLITGVGDHAADRLGDALLEQGDFMAAARAYDLVLTARPDSDISTVRLQVKRATALLRGGYVQMYKELASQIREKHAGESVTVGGKPMAVEDFLASLEKHSKATSQPSVRAAVAEKYPEIPFPSGNSAAWQQSFCDPSITEKITTLLNGNGWGQMMGGVTNSVPAVAADQKRVYLNWYGILWALDLQTGKIAWWSQPFKDLPDKAQMMVQFGVDQRRFALALAGDNLLEVAVRLDRLQNQEPFRLRCVDPATGKEKWKSENGSMSRWAFLGAPLVVDDTIYALAHPRENQREALLAIKLSDGTLLWSSDLGTAQAPNGWNGMPTYSVPGLKYDQGFVYVMTNNGATLAVETATHSIAWSFSYEIPAPAPQENGWMFVNGMMVQQGGGGANMDAGAAFLHDGKLVFKSGANSSMYSIDPAGPNLAFKRPVDDDQLLCGVDDTGLYLVGGFFSFIDPQSRQLKWAPPLPTDGQTVLQPLRSGDDFLVFTSRGIYRIHPAEQKMDLFRGIDLDSVGGTLLHVGNKLISVSNHAVTAYDIGSQVSAR